GGGHRVGQGRRRSAMSVTGKRLVPAVAFVGGLGIGYVAVKGSPPVGEDGKGAIGTAQKYRAEQIKSEDVVLQNPETQQWMQSDAFHRLLNDPAARKALTSPEFRALLANEDLRQALARPAVR